MNEYMRQRQEHINKGRPLPEKKKNVIPKKSAKRIEKEKEQKATGVKEASKLELDVWFNNIKEKHWGIKHYCECMECGTIIPVTYSRHATAHLLPKKLFKSVATHELNYLILGAQCCHEKTHRVDKFVTMDVWPEAARRIKVMMPLLPFDELKYLSSQLLTALDQTP